MFFGKMCATGKNRRGRSYFLDEAEELDVRLSIRSYVLSSRQL